MAKISKGGMGRQARLLLVNLVRAALAAMLIWILVGSMDWYAPWIALKPETTVLGARTDFIVETGDKDSGLKAIRVTVEQEGRTREVLARSFPRPGLWGFGSKGSRVVVQDLPFTLNAQALGLKEGKATLMVTVHDHSWRNRFQGREASLTREVVFDLVPLKVSFQAVSHLLKPGGSGLILYRQNKPAKESGLQVGGRFYRGFPHPQGKAEEYVVLFPVPQDAVGSATADLMARSEVGAEARQRVSLNLKPRKWRADRMDLSEKIMRQVTVNFPAANPGDALASYLWVNRDLRQENHERVRQACAQSEPKPLWSGAFLRYLGKPMARFGDRRTYVYQGRVVDQQVHLGEDLASLERSPVPAANNGVVVLAEPLGIYGQTVLVDHGLGVFSMYSHLSEITVKTGDRVERGAVLGRTGATGLAGGDHLHFSMALQGEFVDPVEWWDGHWLKDQVEGLWSKGEAVAAPAAAPKGKAKSAKGKPKKSQER